MLPGPGPLAAPPKLDGSNAIAPLPPRIAKCFASCENATAAVKSLSAFVKVVNSCAVFRFHTSTVPLNAALASVVSFSENATAFTDSVCPVVKVRSPCPVFGSQNRIVPSALPLTRHPAYKERGHQVRRSGALMVFLCPLSVARSRPVPNIPEFDDFNRVPTGNGFAISGERHSRNPFFMSCERGVLGTFFNIPHPARLCLRFHSLAFCHLAKTLTPGSPRLEAVRRSNLRWILEIPKVGRVH